MLHRLAPTTFQLHARHFPPAVAPFRARRRIHSGSPPACKSGLRVTDPRIALLALLARCPQPITIERLFELAQVTKAATS